MPPRTAKPPPDDAKEPSWEPELKPEKWLQARIKKTAGNTPRYEASYYGPYNCLLCHYFPYQRKFLVKPQPKLRIPYNADAADFNPDLISAGLVDRISYTSTGYLVIGRDVPGSVFLEPDFVVVKATEGIRSDRSLLHVEIKLEDNEERWNMAKVQLIEYMETAAHAEQIPMSGLLICGGRVEIYQMKTLADPARRVEKRCAVNSQTLWAFLQAFASENGEK
ncbi:hypothetical protein C0989_004352 [Termitomyces sp. Mn162]|nr:hypothetical protein C0989_004352 [Termitomyces sp. Mn162]